MAYVNINMPGDQEYNPNWSKQNLDNADFNSQKILILDILSSITANIRESDRIKREKTSHPLALVRVTTRIEFQLRAARTELDNLIAILSKIVSSKRLKRRYSDEEIKDFNDTLKNLEDQLAICETSIRYKSTDSSRKVKLNLNLNEPTDLEKSTVSQEDQNLATETIRQWKERDETFNAQLQEIGEAVDRIGEVASEIGKRAVEQTATAIETVTFAQNTTAEITNVSLKIKKILKRQRRVECTIRIVLIVTTLSLLTIFLYLALTIGKG